MLIFLISMSVLGIASSKFILDWRNRQAIVTIQFKDSPGCSITREITVDKSANVGDTIVMDKYTLITITKIK